MPKMEGVSEDNLEGLGVQGFGGQGLHILWYWLVEAFRVFSWDQEDVEVAVRRAAQPFQFRVLSGFGDATVDCCFAEIPSVRT